MLGVAVPVGVTTARRGVDEAAGDDGAPATSGSAVCDGDGRAAGCACEHATASSITAMRGAVTKTSPRDTAYASRGDVSSSDQLSVLSVSRRPRVLSRTRPNRIENS